MGKISSKKHIGSRAVGFGSLLPFGFTRTLLVASQAQTNILIYKVISCAVKIPSITVMADTASPGVSVFNVTVGSAASAATLITDNGETTAPPTYTQPAGAAMFGVAGQAVTLTALVPQTFISTVPDAIYGKNTVLSVRVTTGGTVNGYFYVEGLAVPIDPVPYIPAVDSATGAFLWSSIL